MMKVIWSVRLAMLLAAVSLTGSYAMAGSDDHEPYPRIVVSGQGEVDVAPDMAVLQLSVTREANTARAALDANSDAMRDVLAAMQA